MAHLHTDKTYDICEEEGEVEPPFCPHGPTLLFTQSNSEGDVIEKFYACAACRSRKECSFYQVYGKRDTEDKKNIRLQIYEQNNDKNLHFKNCTADTTSPLIYCMDCGVIVPNDLCTDTSHPYQYKELSTEEINYPSRWIKAKESNKTNAQYFFSADVIEFLGQLISAHNIDRVLCLGVPTVHEHIQHAPQLSSVRSFLLDFDVRLRQFYKDYAHYNMFNHHLYVSAEKERFEEFVSGAENLMIIVDPPYGGLIQALRLTLDKITAATKAKVTALMFFPYFMEAQMRKHLPSLVISDYKVNYANHAGYQGDKRVRGSPARLYTDIAMEELVLPAADGYKLCEKCKRYVSKENQHCEQCDSCTTKDGPTYKHCYQCEKCTKPSRVHCNACNKCELVEHSCVKDSNSSQTGHSRHKISKQKTSTGQSRKHQLQAAKAINQWQPKRKKYKKNDVE